MDLIVARFSKIIHRTSSMYLRVNAGVSACDVSGVEIMWMVVGGSRLGGTAGRWSAENPASDSVDRKYRLVELMRLERGDGMAPEDDVVTDGERRGVKASARTSEAQEEWRNWVTVRRGCSEENKEV